jgi:hypothetical protein
VRPMNAPDSIAVMPSGSVPVISLPDWYNEQLPPIVTPCPIVKLHFVSFF